MRLLIHLGLGFIMEFLYQRGALRTISMKYKRNQGMDLFATKIRKAICRIFTRRRIVLLVPEDGRDAGLACAGKQFG